MKIPRTLTYLLFFAREISYIAIGWAAFIVSRFETGPAILSDEPGDRARDGLGTHVAVFCHFDAHGRIFDHTRAYIEALCTEKFDVVFVTNSSHLAPADHAWLRVRAARIVSRRNLGHDFAGWRDAIAACGLPTSRTRFLLIVNDSVYGPLRPLGPILSRINFDEADLWSVTDSWQHRFHLQSFFVAFGPRALHHEAFTRFWTSVGNVRSKRWIVRHYELGLSRIFLENGLRCRALWPYIRIIEALRLTKQIEVGPDGQNDDAITPVVAGRGGRSRHPLELLAEARLSYAEHILNAVMRRAPLNPMADLWHTLIEMGCPFLKRELLRKNPTRVPDVAEWSPLVGGLDKNSFNMIMSDLELFLKNKSP